MSARDKVNLNDLWRAEMLSVEDIAALWKVPKQYARDKLVKQEGFPAPAPGSTRKFQRWLRSHVEAFARGETN